MLVRIILHTHIFADELQHHRDDEILFSNDEQVQPDPSPRVRNGYQSTGQSAGRQLPLAPRHALHLSQCDLYLPLLCAVGGWSHTQLLLPGVPLEERLVLRNKNRMILLLIHLTCADLCVR